jgi:hypothetical protein
MLTGREGEDHLHRDVNGEKVERHGDHLLSPTLADRTRARQPPQNDKTCRQLNQRVRTEPDERHRPSNQPCRYGNARLDSVPAKPDPR